MIHFVNSAAYSQSNHKNFRRHFIIAYDVSSPFVNSEISNNYYRQSLIALFNNQEVLNFSEANLSNLENEKKNGLKFFDINKDEISFFHFGVASSEFNSLQLTNNSLNDKGKVDAFNKVFLKNKEIVWTDNYNKLTPNVYNYFSKIFTCRKDPVNFGLGVTLSNYVYPLILNSIDPSKYAEEYILILLSDFLSGTMHGNKNDFKRIKELYGYSTNATNLPATSAPVLLNTFANLLSANYYKIDFFEFAFLKTQFPQQREDISIIGYKIKPKAGNYNPEDLAIFMDSDIELEQRGYRSGKFRIPATALRFTHNENLKPIELKLKISIPNNGTETLLFEHIVAIRNQNGEWTSDYTADKGLMNFNKSKSLYQIPTLKLNLDTIINKKEFEYIKFEYKINSSYKVDGSNPLNFIHSTERLITKENVNFTAKTSIIVMLYIIPAFILLLIIIYLAIIGKPIGIKITINGYLDSFESIDYKHYGKLHTPYKYWNLDFDAIVADGEVLYRFKNYIFNWKPTLNIEITDVEIPEGFDAFNKPKFDTVKEFSRGNVMQIQQKKGNIFKFIMCLRQNDINLVIADPRFIRMAGSVKIRETRLLGINNEISQPYEYSFHIGEDLGDVWVAFDPGTTGSCVAVGNHANNIVLADVSKTRATGPKIMPSLLTFDDSASPSIFNGNVPDDLYKYGSLAYTNWDIAKFKYQSIKKLLGFKDKKSITFKNNITISLNGKELSALLVKGLYQELKSFALKLNNPEITSNYKFDPKRAVIAIPNNFTISKIQDIVDCTSSLKQFKEIRYVYEAEAVLFYYLSNYSRFNKKDKIFNKENILVFDMGGATINTTIVSASKVDDKNGPVYYIDFLGKIGYGIGGDTIDYCLIKFILSFKDDYPALRTFNLLKNKEQLSKLVQEIKYEIVNNYKQDYDYLITYANLQKYINTHLKIDIFIEEDSKIYAYFKKNTHKKFKLLSHPLFANIIFGNVKDAVNEVIELSGNVKVDKIIYSGRSTFFPGISEWVEQVIKEKGSSPEIITLEIEESKTAVAHGACWYGINKNSIVLNNLKTNASFGIKRTLSADISDVEFIELIQMGVPFDSDNAEIDCVSGAMQLAENFAFDGGKVHYYQVMGKDANVILSKNQKHKYSKIASIRLPLATTALKMTVSENDEVECKVKLSSNQIIMEKGVVSDQDISDANEEHYTWIIN
ncbi:MAG: Hsp70 family protein [Lentimicrobium sp.]|nr:Hsp70 family protein [Lentimicrobium sp.]